MACENCPLQNACEQLADNGSAKELILSLAALTTRDAIRVWSFVLDSQADPVFEVNDSRCQGPKNNIFGGVACRGELRFTAADETEASSVKYANSA